MTNMNTQDWIDWAFVQQCERPEQKLMLIGFAFKANSLGGGRVKLGYLMTGTRQPSLETIGTLVELVRKRLILFRIHPSPSDDNAENEEIEFRLLIGIASAS